MMGRIAPDIRLPLHAMSEAGKAKLRALLSQLGLAK